MLSTSISDFDQIRIIKGIAMAHGKRIFGFMC